MLPYENVRGVHIHRAAVLPTVELLHFLDWVFQMNLALTDVVLALSRKGLVIDLVHAHDWLVYYAAYTIKQELRTPLIATIHATELGEIEVSSSHLYRNEFIHLKRN